MRDRRGRRGFVFWLLAVSLLAVLGIAGLAVDVGRLWVIKGEAQSFADLASLAAARELDGTWNGLERARQVVGRNPMRWDFGSRPFQGTRVEFSSDGRRWEERPANPSAVCRARVTARLEAIELLLIPAVIGQRTAAVSVMAASASEPASAFAAGAEGLLPFAIAARHEAKPHYGLSPGDQVALTRYIQDPSPADLREAITKGAVGRGVAVGGPVREVAAPQAELAAALEQLAREDSNRKALTYFDYLRAPGNGKRLAWVAVTAGSSPPIVVGFARVFLPILQNPAAPAAEWIGSPAGAAGRGAASVVRLTE